jgi:adenosylcobinamide-phosphate guanylyltransferase
MAGGTGSRLNLGEKPLIMISGQPMIAYIIGAFRSAGYDPVVATSLQTPMTTNWCRVQGIEFCKTEGKGYVEDMVSAVRILDVKQPLFICVSDIPCITADIIRTIAQAYRESRKDACSVWVPAILLKSCRGGMPYREKISGFDACPAGVNILRGDRIDLEQDEEPVLLNEPRLAFNVNTRADLAEAESFLNKQVKKE